jgi:hypothetical protein
MSSTIASVRPEEGGAAHGVGGAAGKGEHWEALGLLGIEQGAVVLAQEHGRVDAAF